MSNSAVGFSSSDIGLGCNPAPTQRATESIRSLNAPLLASLAQISVAWVAFLKLA